MKRGMPLLVALMLVVACGDDDESDQLPPPRSAAQQAAAAARQRADSIRRDSIARVQTGVGGQPGAPGQASGAGGVGVGTPGNRVVASGERIYTVQVASYLSEENAEQLRQRLEGQGVPVWTTRANVRGRTFSRVRIGATHSVSEARTLGTRIRRQYQWPVWIAPVGSGESIPQDAIDATHSWLSRS